MEMKYFYQNISFPFYDEVQYEEHGMNTICGYLKYLGSIFPLFCDLED